MVVLRNDVDLVKNIATGQVTTTNVQRDVTVEAITFDLASKVQTALNNNATFLSGVAARRSAIATDKTAATTGQTVTVGNVAAAQTQIRAIYTQLTHAATALDDLNNQAEANAKQSNALIKLLAGIVLGNPALLQDNTNT